LRGDFGSKPVKAYVIMKTIYRPFVAVVIFAALSETSAVFAAPAAENFENHCAKCHGDDGKGQTKPGKKLRVRDMTTAEYKKELDDAKALAVLKEGITKDGKEIKKSYTSELTEAEMIALIAFVRALP
jgi:cytochrome c6